MKMVASFLSEQKWDGNNRVRGNNINNSLFVPLFNSVYRRFSVES